MTGHEIDQFQEQTYRMLRRGKACPFKKQRFMRVFKRSFLRGREKAGKSSVYFLKTGVTVCVHLQE